MIHVLEIGFTLLNKRNKFMILTPIGCAADGLGRSKVHIALNINTCKIRSSYTSISKLWLHQSLFIINKLSMIYLRLFATINK